MLTFTLFTFGLCWASGGVILAACGDDGKLDCPGTLAVAFGALLVVAAFWRPT